MDDNNGNDGDEEKIANSCVNTEPQPELLCMCTQKLQQSGNKITYVSVLWGEFREETSLLNYYYPSLRLSLNLNVAWLAYDRLNSAQLGSGDWNKT